MNLVVLLSAEPKFNLNNFSLQYPSEKIPINNNSLLLPEFDSLKPKIALTLSGGGARGIAHLGVIFKLEENHIIPNYIVGTSIGSLIGGLYSLGYKTQEIQTILDTTDWDKLLSLRDNSRSYQYYDQKKISDRTLLGLRFNNFKFVYPKAISRGNKISHYLQNLFWNSIYHTHSNFDNYKFPFRVVATDLVSGQSISFREGDILSIIQGSISYPLQIEPTQVDSMLLIDGGIFANIPTKAARELKPDIVLLVNTTSPLFKFDEINSMINVADQTASIMMNKFSEENIKLADMIIEPKLDDYKNNDFTHIPFLVQSGSNACQIILDDLEQRINTFAINKLKTILSHIDIDSINNKNLLLEGFRKEIQNDILDLFGNSDSYSFIDLVFRIYNIKDIWNYHYSFSIKYTNDKKITLSVETYPEIKSLNIFKSDNKQETITNLLQNKFINQPLNSKVFRLICEETIKYYREAGFAFAHITSVEYNNDSLKIYIEEGRLGEITIQSELKTLDYFVKRELNIEKNYPLKTDKIMNSWNNLMSTDMFSDVQFKIYRNSIDSTLDFNIKLNELGNQMLNLGIRIDNERYLYGGIDFIQHNMVNSGVKLIFRINGGQRNFNTSLGLIQQRFLNTNFTSQLSLYYNSIYYHKYTRLTNSPINRFRDSIIYDYIEQSYGIKAAAGLQLGKLGVMNFIYRTENQRKIDLSTTLRPIFTNLNTITILTEIDNQDRNVFAHRGSLINLILESSLFKSANEPTFSKATFLYKSNLSFGNHTIHPLMLFGFADRTTPDIEQYSLGGEDMFYGYGEAQMRGRQLALVSLEYEYQLPFKILFDTYFSVRYDIGSTWEKPEIIKFSGLKHGLGTSLALDSPIGPIRISVGQGFYFLREPIQLVRGYPQFYFSIGYKL